MKTDGVAAKVSDNTFTVALEKVSSVPYVGRGGRTYEVEVVAGG